MKQLTRVLLAVPLVALAAGASVLIAWPDTSDATDTDLPAPVAAMADRGLDIVDTFEAPSGLMGYAATFQGRPMAIYLTGDGEHAMLGTFIDGQGKDLSAAPLERVVSGPQGEKAWAQLESTHGYATAARTPTQSSMNSRTRTVPTADDLMESLGYFAPPRFFTRRMTAKSASSRDCRGATRPRRFSAVPNPEHYASP